MITREERLTGLQLLITILDGPCAGPAALLGAKWSLALVRNARRAKEPDENRR
jgi:hypothetical protein